MRAPRRPIEIRNFLGPWRAGRLPDGDNGCMKRRRAVPSIAGTWEQVRSGDLRGAARAAREALSNPAGRGARSARVELHLVAAACAMRQGHHADALRELDAAEEERRKAERELRKLLKGVGYAG